jgi:hypothetical protein
VFRRRNQHSLISSMAINDSDSDEDCSSNEDDSLNTSDEDFVVNDDEDTSTEPAAIQADIDRQVHLTSLLHGVSKVHQELLGNVPAVSVISPSNSRGRLYYTGRIVYLLI